LVGGAALADTKAEKPAEKPAQKAPAKAPKVALVDINSATQEELEAIPEIGTENCHHIIMGRPYAKKEELVTKNILPKETYDKVKDKIVAKAEAKPKK
jgi:competence protein ComEA